MKISFVLGHELPFPPSKGGGVNSLLNGLSIALVKKGNEVTVYSPLFNDADSVEIIDDVKHIRVPGASKKDGNIRNVMAGFPYAIRVREALKPCDVLTCHLWQGFLFSGLRRARVLTHTIHRDPKKALLFFSFFDRIYAASEDIIERAGTVVPSLKSKMLTVHNCVDFYGYDYVRPSSHDNEVRFLYIGRFSADKGLESFIKGFCQISSRNPRIRFIAIGPKTKESGGEPEFLEKMIAFVEESKCANRVEFLGPVYSRAALDSHIASSDVIVLPSIGGETLNMSILESMRIGRALLISDLAANRPLIDPGKTGLLVRAGEDTDWARQIEGISSNRELLHQFGHQAYKYGKAHFSTENIATQYLQDFENLLSLKK